ncbi:hypothetical protein VK98_13740 [Chromobacterium sp. LK11]|nr:hypothetical protein VK98_13740 [Chromobacterium sp. LK11]
MKNRYTEVIMSIKTPSRRHYRPDPDPTSRAELPFAANATNRRGVHCWQVPPIDDQHAAHLLGREFAGHFIKYLQDNPDDGLRNLLAQIAADIDFSDDSAAKGYWEGFFSLLEQVLALTTSLLDVFDYIDRLNAREAAERALKPVAAPGT